MFGNVFMMLWVFFGMLMLSGCICPPCPRGGPPPAVSDPRISDPRLEAPRDMPSPPPASGAMGMAPSDRPAVHIVQPGENLFRIGLRYGMTAEEIMAINGLSDTRIVPGQSLRLRSDVAASDLRPLAPPPAEPPRAVAPPPSGAIRISKDQLSIVNPVEGVSWRWPTQGIVVSTFRGEDVTRQGIRIAGELDQEILAAADGTVTYQGEALAAYGKLIIIKHNNEFLTAYAHNNRFLVKEGDKVRAGQPIATMGSSGSDRVNLGFEVRKNGNPVDPLRYLPRL